MYARLMLITFVSIILTGCNSYCKHVGESLDAPVCIGFNPSNQAINQAAINTSNYMQQERMISAMNRSKNITCSTFGNITSCN